MIAYCLQKTSGDRSFVPVAFERFYDLVKFTCQNPHEKYLIYENSLYVPQLLCACKNGRLLFPQYEVKKETYTRDFKEGDIIGDGDLCGIVLANYSSERDGLITIAWRERHSVVVVNLPYQTYVSTYTKFCNQAVKMVSLRLSDNGEIKIAA